MSELSGQPIDRPGAEKLVYFLRADGSRIPIARPCRPGLALWGRMKRFLVGEEQ
jgi:hypothetical protein